MIYSEPSPFPPSFEGNPWAYLFGLFGDVLSSLIAVAMLMTIWLEGRRRRRAVAAVKANPDGNTLHFGRRGSRWTVLRVWQVFEVGLLIFIIMRSLPDALWMTLWGEVSEPTIRFLLAFDLLMDGFALSPEIVAMLFWSWSRQAVRQKLHDERGVQLPKLTWRAMWPNLRIVLLVLLIAIGVTIGKAHA